ncbi:MAG: hypothetical protein ACFB6R_15375 [Alphaproteobacteria bacterium]
MPSLTSELSDLAGIIASLGKGVAEAQTEMNVDYIKRLKELTAIIATLSDDAMKDEGVQALLQSVAPPRYQFTETTLDVSVDIAESRSVAGAFGARFAAKAVAVNMAVAGAYGLDYRAAARVRTVLHAHTDQNVQADLLTAAAAFRENGVATEAQADREPVNTALHRHAIDLVNSLGHGLNDQPVKRLPSQADKTVLVEKP